MPNTTLGYNGLKTQSNLKEPIQSSVTISFLPIGLHLS
jgi:hypothetical protein